MQRRKDKTSWEKATPWYDKTVGIEGHYYHKEIIFPKLLDLWNLENSPAARVVDLACGQGVLSRQLPKNIPYLGIDISPALIKAAKQYDDNPLHNFQVGDITKALKTEELFTHAAIILALQNLEFPELAIKNGARLLKKGGIFSLVINHPYFRIPRQSSWGIDDHKIQYRRIDRYLSPLKIPIQTHPGKLKDKTETISYHFPLETLTLWLKQAGFVIEFVQEWCSNKVSTGSKAKMENRAREEFPLFMLVSAIKRD